MNSSFHSPLGCWDGWWEPLIIIGVKTYSEYGVQGTVRAVQQHDKTADSVNCCEGRYSLGIRIGVAVTECWYRHSGLDGGQWCWERHLNNNCKVKNAWERGEV